MVVPFLASYQDLIFQVQLNFFCCLYFFFSGLNFLSDINHSLDFLFQSFFFLEEFFSVCFFTSYSDN